MLTETSKTAIRALLFMARAGSDDPCSPTLIADSVGASASYLAKINTLLMKADIVKTFRGMHGGVKLARKPEDLTLLDIVEACQGKILGDYCQGASEVRRVCAYHEAMDDLQRVIVDTLRRWTLADLVARPGPTPQNFASCRMACKPV